MIEALLLAAGSSHRLGQSKLQIQVSGQPLLVRTCRLIAALMPVTVVLRQGDDASAALLAEMEQPHRVREVFADTASQGDSIRCGLKAIGSDVDVLVAVVDQYRLRADNLEDLVECFKRRPDVPCAASYAGTVGVPAVFPAAWQSRLAGQKGGGKSLLRENGVNTVPIANAAFDLDTRADVVAMRRFESIEADG